MYIGELFFDKACKTLEKSYVLIISQIGDD
jgi:hypothetical protein